MQSIVFTNSIDLNEKAVCMQIYLGKGNAIIQIVSIYTLDCWTMYYIIIRNVCIVLDIVIYVA